MQNIKKMQPEDTAAMQTKRAIQEAGSGQTKNVEFFKAKWHKWRAKSLFLQYNPRDHDGTIFFIQQAGL